jgi:hypothetical protein
LISAAAENDSSAAVRSAKHLRTPTWCESPSLNHSLTLPRHLSGNIQRGDNGIMDRTIEHRIRERAYEIWLAGGCVSGEEHQNWLAAEREILAQALRVSPAPAQTPKGKRRKPRARRAA